MKIKTGYLLPAMILYASNCHGLDWLIDPEFGFTERYTDNLRLATTNTPHRDNLISTISPSLLLGYVADDNELKANFNWNQLVYHGESSLDFSEKILTVNHVFNGDRWKTELDAKYGLESSLTTQLDVNGSGLVSAQVGRLTKSISPEFTYKLTEKNSLQLSGTYMDASFEKHPSIGFSDYTNQQVNATIFHNYSEQLSFNFNTGYSIYKAGNNFPGTANEQVLAYNLFLTPNLLFNDPYNLTYSQKSTTLSYQLGLQYAFSEQMLFSATAGIRDTTSHSSEIYTFGYVPGYPSGYPGYTPAVPGYSVTSNTNGKIYSASLTRDFETGNFSLSANQQLNPASTGSQMQTSSITASVNYNFSERWTAGFMSSYLIAQAVSAVNTSLNNLAYFNRNLTTLSPNVQWQWTPDIHLKFSYTYMEQNYTQTNQSAFANNVQLQFIYQPQINRQVK